MTQQEFDNIAFGAGMQVVYRGHVYAVVTVNFKERLLGLYDGLNAKDYEDSDVDWVRCESVELVNAPDSADADETTPAKQAKAYGANGLKELSDVTKQSKPTLSNWHYNKPELFRCVCAGVVALRGEK